MRLTYEDIQSLSAIIRKLDEEEAATLLAIIIQIIESQQTKEK